MFSFIVKIFTRLFLLKGRMKEILLRKLFVILATGHYIALSRMWDEEVRAESEEGNLKCPVSQKLNLYMVEKIVMNKFSLITALISMRRFSFFATSKSFTLTVEHLYTYSASLYLLP